MATLLGTDIVNECPCSAKVDKDDRQEIVWHEDEQKWYRMCEKCIRNGARFTAPKPENPGLEIVTQ